jgi:S-adenosylmethionine decarboxylase
MIDTTSKPTGRPRPVRRRLGQHAIVDVSGADRPLEEAEVTSLLADMARASGATLLRIETHQFGVGHGLTAIAVLAESHISLHEWPEYRFVAFDIFVCGSADPEPAIGIIRSRFPGAHLETQIIDRGNQ